MQKEIFNWKWRLHQAGVTQKEFCQRFGFAEGLFSDWVRGRKQPKYSSIDKVESALKELGV